METFYINNFFSYKEPDSLDLSTIPPLTRRRMSTLEKIATYLGLKSRPKTNDYNLVFASNWGEWQITEKLIRHYHDEKEFLPSKFSCSVHNAFCGIFSILTSNTSSYTSIASSNDSIEMGLIESFISNKPSLLIYADESTPELYRSHMNPITSSGLSCFISSTPLSKDSSSLKIAVSFDPPSNSDSNTITQEVLTDFLTQKTSFINGKHLRIDHI